MRIRKKPWAEKELRESSIFLQYPLEHSRHLSSLFSREQPLIVELGCGKGLFLLEYAPSHLDINFIGIDIKNDILAVAHRNITASYAAHGQRVENILLLPYDIERIGSLFSENTQCDAIYIHFPNPWQKARHKKRRLTHPRQLIQYRCFLKPEGFIFFKTDDRELFNDTKIYLKECAFDLLYISEDYYRDVMDMGKYPQTEHELMFRAEGKPIFYIEAQKRETV